jgi:hypothetical protein
MIDFETPNLCVSAQFVRLYPICASLPNLCVSTQFVRLCPICASLPQIHLDISLPINVAYVSLYGVL